jgi:hypothetical protein
VTDSVEVQFSTGQVNDIIANTIKADKRYNQFKGKEDQVLPAGMIGPVMMR